MKIKLDQYRFGPWALVTGASSGIGREFARQIAASGINVVLVARRAALLAAVGQSIEKDFGVQYRAFALDLSDEAFLSRLAFSTKDLDIGLIVSNAGTGNPGEFLKLDRQLLQANLRLNTMAHLDIAHHFGNKLAERRTGGMILMGAMGAEIGVPFLANDGGAKAYGGVAGGNSGRDRHPWRIRPWRQKSLRNADRHQRTRDASPRAAHGH
jgi:uncharacterized protein